MSIVPTLLYSLFFYLIFNPTTKQYFILTFLLYGICFFSYVLIFSLARVSGSDYRNTYTERLEKRRKNDNDYVSVRKK